MKTANTSVPIQREPELLEQTVVVIGGSAGIGLETARRARAEGAKLILTGRNLERLHAASEVDALSTGLRRYGLCRPRAVFPRPAARDRPPDGNSGPAVLPSPGRHGLRA